MSDTNILDADFIALKDKSFFEGVAWWEKRRLIYNIILISLEVLIMLYFWEGTEIFGIGPAIFQSFLYTLVANAFFCAGWGLEIFIKYYFGGKFIGDGFRTVFFILGISFSILLTCLSYGWTLY